MNIKKIDLVKAIVKLSQELEPVLKMTIHEKKRLVVLVSDDDEDFQAVQTYDEFIDDFLKK